MFLCLYYYSWVHTVEDFVLFCCVFLLLHINCHGTKNGSAHGFHSRWNNDAYLTVFTSFCPSGAELYSLSTVLLMVLCVTMLSGCIQS